MQLPTILDPRDVKWCKDYGKTIRDRCERNAPGRRPLNVVFVGLTGSGKSSFINSLAASVSHESWAEHSPTGIFGGARPVTTYIHQFKQCCNEETSFYQNVLLPTLTDTPGLQEDGMDNKQIIKFLLLLFYGHIQNDADGLRVLSDCKKDWNDLMSMYWNQHRDMKADRVVFVASADRELPYRLMDCVMKAARPPSTLEGFKRQIPVYGVLTHGDKIHVDHCENFIKAFKSRLCLNDGRFLCFKNYCDETDPYGKRLTGVIPSLDLPILKFFAQVCDRRIRTINDDDRLDQLSTAHDLAQMATSGRNREILCSSSPGLPSCEYRLEIRASYSGVAGVPDRYKGQPLHLQNRARLPADTSQLKQIQTPP